MRLQMEVRHEEHQHRHHVPIHRLHKVEGTKEGTGIDNITVGVGIATKRIILLSVIALTENHKPSKSFLYFLIYVQIIFVVVDGTFYETVL